MIVGTNGLPVLLKGVIWSGFDNGTMVNGLQVGTACLMCASPCTAAMIVHRWNLSLACGIVQGDSSVTADFSTQVVRIRALGFNAVKLPFSAGTLLGSAVSALSTACTTASDAQVQVPLLAVKCFHA